ncbi:MAG TPA: hypothetical protein VEA61_08870 [Allosphingosinicella sp.]|nr:hypothetical protein [Allosphingosinicella sp.]
MDAPKGRYRVVEKEGRLIVIDNETGAPIPSSVAAPPQPRRGRPSDAPMPPVTSAGPGPIDRAADFLVAVVAKEWDAQGRAVIAWQWRQNGRVRRWDAALDEAAQRRLGHALLALFAAPIFLVSLTFTDGALFGLGTVLALPPLAWGAVALARLHRDTNDPNRAP